MTTAKITARHYPETILPRTGHLLPAGDTFVDTRRWMDFIAIESCLDAPAVLPAGGSRNVYSGITEPGDLFGYEPYTVEFCFVGRERA